MLVGVDTTLAGAQAELVEQAKWREHPNRDTPEHVRDQAELWAGQARTVLEWAKSLSNDCLRAPTPWPMIRVRGERSPITSRCAPNQP